MKKLASSLLIFIPLLAFAQHDTTKIDQFCEMTAQGKFLSTKITIEIDFGAGKGGLFSQKDTRVRDEISGKLKSFKSTVDALNYMGAKGWKLIDAFPITESSGLGGTQSVYHFFFVKSFDRSELVENKNEIN